MSEISLTEIFLSINVCDLEIVIVKILTYKRKWFNFDINICPLKKLCFDLDGVICTTSGNSYKKAKPKKKIIIQKNI